jgi:hypothetical protein
MIEGRKAHPTGAGPRGPCLGPRGFSAGVVDSLEEGFVLHKMGFGGRMVYQE